ncbi:beta-lactamase family protein, partial [Xanthomonas sp. Kuri4-1]
MEAALADRRLVGAVVLVQRDGKRVYHRAAGLADREAGTPMREDTLFRLASVSKPVVTTAAMALVARGKLDLEAPVTRWLPQFRPALADGSRPPITLRQLLCHTSGLGYRFDETGAVRPYREAGVSDGLDRPGFDLDENLRRLASAPLGFRPGTQWRYSLGIDVAGAVVQRAADAPLDQAVQRLVGAPLGWRDTGFHATDPRRLAVPYVNDTPAP